jgi:hydrogenase maturation protease
MVSETSAMDQKPARVVVIGIGNILMKDEGIGIYVINELINNGFHEKYDIEIIDGGITGLGMLEYMKDKEKVIIIDAIDFNSPPGTLFRFNYADNPAYKQATKYSIHQIDAIDSIDLLHNVYCHYPEIIIMGMQPYEIEIDMQLSDHANSKLSDLTALVVKELENAY